MNKDKRNIRVPKELHSGAQLGEWIAREPIAGGGNGVVVRVKHQSSDKEAALKFRRESGPRDSKERFANEIESLQKFSDIPGVVKLLDCDPNQEKWYVMPLLTRIDAALAKEAATVKVQAIADVAFTLAEVHSRGAAHRDIKPANILWNGQRPVVADFGLVRLLDKDGPTLKAGKNPGLGPRLFLPPELQSIGVVCDLKTIDWQKVDVFELGKTLWVLSTGFDLPFWGPHDSSIPQIDISIISNDPSLADVNQIAADMTRFNSLDRPGMSAIAKSLADRGAPKITDNYDELVSRLKTKFSSEHIMERPTPRCRRFRSGPATGQGWPHT